MNHRNSLILCSALGLGLAAAVPARAQEGSEVDALRARLAELEKRLEAVEGTAKDPSAVGAPEGSAAPEASTEPAAPAEKEASAKKGKKGTFSFDLPGGLRLRLWGQARWRGEYRGDTYVQPKTNSTTDFVGQRTRLGLDFDLNKHLGVRVALQDVRRWGDVGDGLTGPRLATDRAEIHLYEGYGELRRPWDLPLTLRVGRMRVPQLGDQRLISNLDWHLVSRSWDGVQATFEPEGWWIMAFAHNVREPTGLVAGTDENDDLWFSGLYVSNRMVEDLQVDLFLYWRWLGDNKLGAIVTDHKGDRGVRTDYTFGARVKGKAGPLGYGGLIAYQYGDQAGDIVAAWAGAVTLSFVQPLGGGMKFKVLAEYAYASGDPDPTDSRVQTFDPLLPFAHYYHGHQDLFAWRNLHAVALKAAFWPLKWLSLHADTHFFFLDRRDDRWYGVGFTRTDGAGAARHWDSGYVGAETDLYVKFKVLEHISVWGGYSHFFEGAYVRATGSKSSDQDWAFLMVTLDF